MRIKLPAGLLDGRGLHFPRTTVVVLSGEGAVAKANPAWLTSVLCGPGGLPVEAVGGLYKFENPTRWFLAASEKMTQAAYDKLHGQTIHVPGTGITLRCEHVEKERDRITIHWLPPTYTMEAVTVVVRALTGDGSPEVFRAKEGKWGALCRPTQPIPHYAEVEVPGRKEQWHAIMITMPGRRTECRHCSSEEHWSNKCPKRNSRSRKFVKSSETDVPPPQDEEGPAGIHIPQIELASQVVVPKSPRRVAGGKQKPETERKRKENAEGEKIESVPEMPQPTTGKEKESPRTSPTKSWAAVVASTLEQSEVEVYEEMTDMQMGGDIRNASEEEQSDLGEYKTPKGEIERENTEGWNVQYGKSLKRRMRKGSSSSCDSQVEQKSLRIITDDEDEDSNEDEIAHCT